MRSIWGELVVGGALCLLLLSCSDDDGDHHAHGGSTEMKGTLVGPGGESGVLEVLIEADRAALESAVRAHAGHHPPDGAIRASGLIRWQDGTNLGLVGWLDAALLQLHGDAPNGIGGYELDGTWVDGGLAGTYTSPRGGEGVFTLAYAADVRVYCGTYTQTGGGETGTWNLMVQGTDLIGLSRGTGSTATDTLTGTLDGNSFILNEGDASGVIDENDRVSGSYTDGTFEGARCDL